MDKRIIFAVAGSGKTTYIVESLNINTRCLILTYTDANYDNLSKKILRKFNDSWPDNITLMTWFQFLFRFCYKPLLSDEVGARGLLFESNENRWAKKDSISFYLTNNKYFYSNRLALFIEEKHIVDEVITRIKDFFDVLVIDEVQDIAGRDFAFLEKIMAASLDMLFVGDFFQHTYDTSRDGNVNQNLFSNFKEYEKRFINKGFISDKTTLVKTWRCGEKICAFVRDKLGISIFSNKCDDSTTGVIFVEDSEDQKRIALDESIIKLHYKDSSKWGYGHRNWGDVKGEDCFNDVCVYLNKKTQELYRNNKLYELPEISKNKLYVAITRAHDNVFLLCE